MSGRNLYEKLKAMFKEIKKFNRTNPTSEERAAKYETMTKELKATIKYLLVFSLGREYD